MNNYKLTRSKLLYDLYYAFTCAKKHKSKKNYVIEFEKNLHENLVILRDELYERHYKPLPSICFIINDPKKREVFAANFRDRIVHHLFYNYVYSMFDSIFIEDSYSCRMGKGTSYGISRLQKHIRQETVNYTVDAYALKMDIKGYFIHIDRLILLDIVNQTLDKLKYKIAINNADKKRNCEVVDFDFLSYLCKEIIMLNPVKDCIIRSLRSEWDDLEKTKSLFNTRANCGLPIGNLTSQLFSNLYLNLLDQYVKRELKCKHYGRYVDDFYIIMQDKEKLAEIVPKITNFLKTVLHLDVQEKKTHIINTRYGIEFLGAFVKHGRTYVSNKTLKKIKKGVLKIKREGVKQSSFNSINSYLGYLRHYDSFKIRQNLFQDIDVLTDFGFFDKSMTKYATF